MLYILDVQIVDKLEINTTILRACTKMTIRRNGVLDLDSWRLILFSVSRDFFYASCC